MLIHALLSSKARLSISLFAFFQQEPKIMYHKRKVKCKLICLIPLPPSQLITVLVSKRVSLF